MIQHRVCTQSDCDTGPTEPQGVDMYKVVGLAIGLGLIIVGSMGCEGGGSSGGGSGPFGGNDLISLHYDHAPDRDDGQSAAADRTLLQSTVGTSRAIAVSGAHGRNGGSFNPASDNVMNAAWPGQWTAAHGNREAAVASLAQRWGATLRSGGDIWVKEGGQSDLTAAVVAQIKTQQPDVNTKERIHVVQHGEWNEAQTTPSALQYVRAETDYIRIPNANSYLKGPRDEAFVQAAVNHPVHGSYWQAAFDYYPNIIDFSDTGELMYILGLGQIGIDEFRARYLDQ